MSTRASIIIKDCWNNRIHIYHHYDGYPEGVGMAILEVLKGYRKNNYTSQWQYAESMANDLLKNPKIHLTTSDVNGEKKVTEYYDNSFEISTGVHGDIDYLYIINCKFKTIRCYRRFCGEDWHECVKRDRIVEIPEDEFTRID